jgi:hypothetical protein
MHPKEGTKDNWAVWILGARIGSGLERGYVDKWEGITISRKRGLRELSETNFAEKGVARCSHDDHPSPARSQCMGHWVYLLES